MTTKINGQRMRYLIAGAIVAVYVFLTSFGLQAQDQGFIYGTVSTIDGKEYKGQLRWGKEETFWDDIFNSSKEENDWLRYLDRGDYKYVRNNRNNDDDDGGNWIGSWTNIWSDDYSNHTHQFAIRFGDIDKIQITGRDDVEVTFKDGKEWDLEGGSNDVGATISVFDPEIGQIKLDWGRIDEIKFMDAPNTIKGKAGEPLTGTVETRKGTFTGLIQWDHEECLSIDKLDGDTEDGDVSIEMGNIASIEKDGRGSTVTLKSGRKLYLWGSNDVNDENRGVIVKDPAIGKVKIGWDDFEMVTFDDKPKGSGPAYKDYGKPAALNGTVVTENGEKLSGRIVYDLDEEYDFELLDGQDDDIEYAIPFRNVKSVKIKNFNYSSVTLRSGKILLLGDGQDVSDKNDGMLVFTSEGDPTYVPWDDIEEIIFD